MKIMFKQPVGAGRLEYGRRVRRDGRNLDINRNFIRTSTLLRLRILEAEK